MKITVDWPNGLSRERLEWLAGQWDKAYGLGDAVHALRALAAIAPNEKPKVIGTTLLKVWVDKNGTARTCAPTDFIAPAGVNCVEVPILEPETETVRVYRSKTLLQTYTAIPIYRDICNPKNWTLVGELEVPK